MKFFLTLALLALLTIHAGAQGTTVVKPTPQSSKTVRVAGTANVTIATALNPGDTLDGVTLAAGDRVLLKNQTTTAENGIYIVAATPFRAADADTWAELPGTLLTVKAGSANKARLWAFSGAETGTLGSTAITWSEKAASGGGGTMWGNISGTLVDQTDLYTIIEGSDGGNGAGDAGKLVKFGAGGGLTTEDLLSLGGITSGTANAANGSINLYSASHNFLSVLSPSSALTDEEDYILPSNGGTLVTQDGTATLSNKRITPRVQTITVNTTPNPDELTQNGDSYDGGIVTSLAAATKLMNPTGTPVDGQRLWLRIKSAGARTLTYDTQYRFSTDVPQPSATSGSNLTDYLVFQWNAADSKWDCITKNFGF